MSLTGNNILGGASGQTIPYDIPYSIKTAGTSERISRTMNSTGAATAYFTYSTWYKKSQPVTAAHLLWWQCTAIHSNAVVALSFPADPSLRLNLWTGSASEADRYSSEKYRDPAAWMHFVWQWNGATLAMYMNGVLIDMSTSGNINGNSWGLQTGNIMRVSSADHADGDGYTAETYFIEGQTLAPSNFGELNEKTGQWVPIEYKGTFSGNSFYLDYADSSDLGKDVSGLDNHFTVSGGIDANSQVLDTPTNNFATLNPLSKRTTGSQIVTLLDGNLKSTTVSVAGAGSNEAASTMAVSSGKWYAEHYIISIGSGSIFTGIFKSEFSDNENMETATNCVYYLDDGGQKRVNGTNSSYGDSYTTGDIIGVALNQDDNELTFYKNGTAQNSGTAISITADEYVFAWGKGSGDPSTVWNFGQDSSFAGNKTAQGNGGVGEDFYYTPPAGYKALNTDNLDDPAIALPTDHFNTVLYAGDNATSRSITGIGFQPDFSWIKNRTSSCDHVLFDVVRGVADTAAGKQLSSNLTSAEPSNTNGHVKSFDSDGFSLRDGSSGGEPRLNTNKGSTNYASWNWKAGGAASSNGDGSKTSSVSANPTAGFSIVTYTGDGTGPDTVGHGLSSAPELIIVKNRSSVYDWKIYNETIGNTKYLSLNTSDAEATASTNWNDTSPTASVFTVNTNAAVNQDTSLFVAYCFHGVDGYSKVGSYTGNGATDGPFIYTGFRPAFIMVKLTTAAHGQWVVFDNKRDPDNPTDRVIYADLTAISTDVSSYSPYDILSNGFKSRIPAGNGNEASYNSSGQTYIYLAFAESPFKTSNAR